MSTFTIMFTFIFISSIVSFMSNSWILVWSMLEVNTVCFVSIKIIKKKENWKIKTKSDLKYFLIQSISSAMILMSVLILEDNMTLSLMSNLLIVSIMIKIGSPPLHQWFIEIIQLLSKIQVLLLMTWQKSIPIFLLIMVSNSFKMFFVFSSIMISSMMIPFVKNIFLVLGWSSIFNNSWMIMSSSISILITVTFMILYWSAVMFMMKEVFYFFQLNENTSKKKIFTFSLISNLGSLPPTSGFLAKWLVSMKLIKIGEIMNLLIIIMLSMWNSYSYMRWISINALMIKESKMIFHNNLKLTLFLTLFLTPFLFLFFLTLW
uniref:NADH-ubiquinone oxidoreductase chain 2 n=1 Tax=Steganacarus magnus TaxID=52000 RepID=B6Z5V5_9ACAR|nr:NADH dehydrogenase subunit 2 [Steganacarus magnus]ACH41156.1 NADH dehydrogenase subunit 2 [Steganacarus magnus]